MTDSVSYPKRQKVSIACDVCRRRKIKCDGSQPECGPCRIRADPNTTCRWESSRSRDDIRTLQLRIQELEQRNQVHSDLGESNSNANPPSEHSSLWDASPPRRVPRDLHTASEPESPATNAMVGPVESGAGMHGFFGGSSAGNFVTQIHEAATQRLSSSGHLGPTTNKTGPCPRPPRPWGQRLQWPRISLDACALPPRSRADALMDVYWNAVHPLYPFVDRAVFSSQYDGLFATNAPPDIDSSLTCALNIIFALSCQLDTTSSAGSRHQSARIFFQRAQESLDLWRLPPSLESVQVLLLLGQYLQSTNEPFQCWTFVGSAIRMAENLGLHLKATTENVTSVRHREILRRVWHGCILMDRVLAMTYGRPTMINRAVAADTPLPITVDEEDLSDDSRLPPQIADRPSRLDFFVQSLRLYDILDDILVTLYESREKQEHQSKGAGFFKLHQSSIIDIDSQLMDWEESLPEQLRNVPLSHKGQKPPMLPQPTVFFRQAVVLRQRFLHIRMLSLRPILCSLISHSGSTNSTDSTHLGPRIAHQCSLVCIKIAQESIDLVYTYRDSTWATTGVLAAWWYNVLFVYSAATVLQAARLRPALEAELARDDISESWNRAIALLEGYGDYSESIPMLVATLNVLVEQVSRRCANPNSKQRDVGGGEEESTRAAGGGLEEAAMQGPEQNTGMFGDSVVIPGVDWESLLNPGSLPWLDYYSLPVDL